MPVAIKSSRMEYKDDNGNYIGVDAVSERTTAEQVAEIEAVGNATISAVEQAVSESQDAVNTLESQKNAIAQTVASMAQLGTDTSLSTPGMAADAAVVGELKDDLNNKAEQSALDEKVDKGYMQKCTLVNVPKSANLWNKNASGNGIAYIDGRILDGDYKYYRFPVEEGHTYYYYWNGASTSARWTAAYDANGNALSAYGFNGNRNSYTVEAGHGIAYIAPTFGTNANDTVMVLDGVETAPAQYIPYYDAYSYYSATDAFLANTSALTESTFREGYMQRVLCNLLNPAYPTLPFADGGGFGAVLNLTNGKIAESAVYWTTDFIEVVPGETLYLFDSNLSGAYMRFVCTYDKNKNFISGSQDDTRAAFTVPETAKYMRFSRSFSTSWANYLPEHFMLCGTPTPSEFVSYDPALIDKYEFKPSLIPDIPSDVNLHVYLPPEICVGIGRTIELYNELVCLEADKYHLHYSCTVGVQYKRKYSITGSTAGTYPITLKIFNDNAEMVWTGQSTVKVVANNISTELKILPIGDSLTNMKPWLSEVQTLSNNKIKYIGTRGRSDSTIRHEGRSGFTAADYLENTSYSFDSNYQGNPNVQGTVNPFWDGSRFSLSYYNTQQAGTVGTADAIELLLGTNDVFSGEYTAEECAEHITDIIDNIRQDNSTIPVFVCNTIYRSNQNGYYSSGGQGFSAASGWAFDSDIRIMEFQNALVSAIAAKNYTSVYIVPCSVCMDRENDFGQVEVAVNPRLQDVTVTIPSESVHPQNAGYYQMADVMYSSFIAHLT